MRSESGDLVTQAFEAYVRGDVATMMRFIDPDLEWTYLDPSVEDPKPRVCHGRHELKAMLTRQSSRGLRSMLEEVVAHADRVMVVVVTPGLDAYRVTKNDDRTYNVLTVSEDRIVALHAYRDRREALAGVEIVE